MVSKHVCQKTVVMCSILSLHRRSIADNITIRCRLFQKGEGHYFSRIAISESVLQTQRRNSVLDTFLRGNGSEIAGNARGGLLKLTIILNGEQDVNLVHGFQKMKLTICPFRCGFHTIRV
ncbi:hypothetical protein KQX54_020018 [Cotesia glomerata]|uniref:Uncharacterized protein n=1 Tax=Cotesia glomerata TaxID=32391 RepID=A0AAV7IHB1_COTGL|nr:hypothetical protein KQX54_020018 [Cotesia glomerata]